MVAAINIADITDGPGYRGPSSAPGVTSLPAASPALLDLCVAGDRRAWGELHAVYRPQALAFLLRLGVGPRDAEDACQDVFIQVFRYLHGFERRADFRTWLYKVCISQAARVRRRAMLGRPLLWLRRGFGDPVTFPELSASRSMELVDAALATLGARQREVFVLFELEELSTAEIARLLGSPCSTVRRQLQEARHRFERYVRDQPIGGKP